MDDMYNQERQQPTTSGVLINPPAGAVQPQPISYETTPISEDHLQSPTLPDDNVQSSTLPDYRVQSPTLPDNNVQSSTLPDNIVQSPALPDNNAQSSLRSEDEIMGSSIIPGGAQTFIKARSDAPSVQPVQGLSQPGSLSAPLRTISQRLHSEQAFRMLVVAVVAVLISSLALIASFAIIMSSNANNHANQLTAKVQATQAARSTQGLTTAPKSTPIGVPTGTSTPAQQQPAQSPSNPGGNPPSNPGGSPPPPPSGTIPIQFVGLPPLISMSSSQYHVNGNYPITVNTQPGLTVTLYFTYPDGNTYDTGGAADNSGSVTIPWVADSDSLQPPTQQIPITFRATVSDEHGNTGQIQATVQFVVTS